MSETLRIAKRETHVAVLKRALDDPRLSLAAKGLWAYLEAHPDLDGFEAEDLARREIGDVAEIRRCLDELIRAGYLETR